MKKRQLMLFMMAFLLSYVRSDITGTITFDNSLSTIQQTGARYRFSIQGNNPFQPNGKILIVFPSSGYKFSSASSLGCVNLDDSGKVLDCQLNQAAGLLVLRINSTTY